MKMNSYMELLKLEKDIMRCHQVDTYNMVHKVKWGCETSEKPCRENNAVYKVGSITWCFNFGESRKCANWEDYKVKILNSCTSEEELSRWDSLAQRRRSHEEKWDFLWYFEDNCMKESEKEKYLNCIAFRWAVR